MARIRSIKPEFWKSETIAALPIGDRLTFIGLWSYVDDNGVGVDSYKLIAAELYGLEDDPRAVRLDMRETLARLAAASLITRYVFEGKRYFRVTNWDEHQRIDRPNKPRYPKPEDAGVKVLDGQLAAQMDGAETTPADDSRNSRETLAQPSRNPIDWSSGAGEQGNRGVPPTAGRPNAPEPAAATKPEQPPLIEALIAEPEEPPPPQKANEIVAWWIERCDQRPAKEVLGPMSKHIKSLLDQGFLPEHITQGIAELAAKSLGPSSLPSLVTNIANRRATIRAAPTGAAEPGYFQPLPRAS